ncbi:hypothetical protein IAE22_31730, partial [Bacillus sp. S34]|nr:hypothetical protein [Bacillus sp. S34]
QQPEPAPPAAYPELVAATEFARTSHARPSIRRTQIRAGAWIAGVPIVALAVIATFGHFLAIISSKRVRA